MKNYLVIKNLIKLSREYIFIFLTATIFLFTLNSKSISEENLFTINDINIKGTVDVNFSRDKYINKAFLNSFEILMSKILLTKDSQKIKDIKLKKIKNLINKFQIIEESYRKEEYSISIKIFYNEDKVKNFLSEKNISFTQAENISAVFYPVLIRDNEIENFNNNFFYKNWIETKIKNQLITYILPLEDLEDHTKLLEMKNKIEDLDVDYLVNKYSIENYVFILIDYEEPKLKIYLKTKFNNNKTSKNIYYDLESLNNEEELSLILKNLKIKITDLWKEDNIINLLMPLSIKLRFQHNNLENLDKLKNAFFKINIIKKYTLEKFDINNSSFKIYYYGNPKKLSTQLLKHGYKLKNNQGNWQLYTTNE
jgi:hypothetical protein